jgi:dCTP deaminase
MVLSDRDLRLALDGKRKRKGTTLIYKGSPLVIDPLEESRIQPASIDLTLDDEFHVSRERFSESKVHRSIVDLADIKKYAPDPYIVRGDHWIKPGEFVLASTAERVEIPDDLCARVEGKSSLGRLGLLVHLTAGYIDPGFKGKITLEIVNLSQSEIILRPGKAICQLSVIELSSEAEHPYGHESRESKYQNQTKVTASKYDDTRLIG